MQYSRKYYLLALLTFLVSCGTKEQKAEDAIFLAQTYLSKGLCNQALDALADVDPEFYDYYYYQALASAHACKGGYETLDIVNDLENYVSTTDFFNFLASLTPSAETDPNSLGFTQLSIAIDSILNMKSSTESLFSHRLALLESRTQTEEISFQALLMIFVYLGKWMALYGDADTAGTKAAGTREANQCLIDYDDAASQLNFAERTALLGNTGTCNATLGAITGSSHLPFGVSTTRDRLCKVVIYFNHIRDITNNITLSSNSSLGDLSDAFDAIAQYVTDAEVAFPGISNVLTYYNMTDCSAYYDASAANKKNIHAFIGGVVELNFL